MSEQPCAGMCVCACVRVYVPMCICIHMCGDVYDVSE